MRASLCQCVVVLALFCSAAFAQEKQVLSVAALKQENEPRPVESLPQDKGTRVVEPPKQEKAPRSVEALKSAGAGTCANAMSAMSKIVDKKDELAYYNRYKKQSPEQHMALTMTAKPYADAASLATVAATPTPDGACDALFVQVFTFKETCPKLRDTAFKEWKYYNDLGEIPLYKDPTTDSVVAEFTPIPGGCVVVKTGLLFFSAVEHK